MSFLAERHYLYRTVLNLCFCSLQVFQEFFGRYACVLDNEMNRARGCGICQPAFGLSEPQEVIRRSVYVIKVNIMLDM